MANLHAITKLITSGLCLGAFGGCDLMSPKTIDLTQSFSGIEEAVRLDYFKEINVLNTHKHLGLTGKGVRVVIMGEEVDTTHPDLTKNVINQYDTAKSVGKIIRGPSNQALSDASLGAGGGHGTHIAGTIAAACDGVGIQGVACNATMDVYSFGNIEETTSFSNVFIGFTAAMRHITARKDHRIVTASFNIETPAIFTKNVNSEDKLSIDQILEQMPRKNNLDAILSTDYISLQNPTDADFLKRMYKTADDTSVFPLGLTMTQSKEWEQLENAMGDYQAADGVFIVTESNNIFDNHTSTLNAMPSLSDKVDKELWISIVMVEPKEDGSGEYFSPINTCGKLAQAYCIITPSYGVLSTMTARLAEKESPIYIVDGRNYQNYGGHSMGAPMVAAALALMEEYNHTIGSKYTMKDMVNILKQSGNKNFPGFNPELHGQGMLDVDAALKRMGAPL